MTKEFFNIIENHYLYKSINEKMQKLNEDAEFHNIFKEYLNFYDSEIIQNYNLLNLISNAKVKSTPSLPESKKISLENTIKKNNSSEICISFFYSNGILEVKNVPAIQSNFIFHIRKTEPDIEKCFSLTFSLSNSQSFNNHTQKLEISTMDYESYQKTRRYSISLHHKEQKSEINRVVLNNVAIEKNINKEIKIELIDKISVLKIYKELSILNIEQLNILFLTGGFNQEDIDLFKITNDFGNSMDDYVKVNDKNIFDIIKEKRHINKKLKNNRLGQIILL